MFCTTNSWRWCKKYYGHKRVPLAGADKVSINSAAIKNPSLINESSKKFGNQCIVVAIDAKKKSKNWNVFINGVELIQVDAISWAKNIEKRGLARFFYLHG